MLKCSLRILGIWLFLKIKWSSEPCSISFNILGTTGSFSFCMVPLHIMPQRTIIARLKSILILLCAEMQKSRHFCNEIIAEVISLISGSAKISTGRTSFPWAICIKTITHPFLKTVHHTSSGLGSMQLWAIEHCCKHFSPPYR